MYWLRPVVSKGEDELLVCGNKITSTWNDLFNILNPGHVSYTAARKYMDIVCK